MLADIMAKVRTRTALNAEEREFLNVTSLPVYKMINVHAAYEGAFADQTIQAYAEIIAVDLLYGLFDDFAELLSEAGSTATSGDRDAVANWRSQLLKQREFLVQYQIENNARAEVIEQVIARTQGIERQLAGRLSKDLADAYQFSRNAAY
jgi:conjugative transfer pilus assembly protein TraH